MVKETIERYCRRVGRCLRCTRAHKQALVAGLREELGAFPRAVHGGALRRRRQAESSGAAA